MLFKEKPLLYIFIASLLITILIPLLSMFVVYPNFEKALLYKTNEEARRVALHLENSFSSNQYIAKNMDAFSSEVLMLQNHFGVMKLKFFDSKGKIIFSTDTEDMGKVNDKPYFHNKVAHGEEYSKLVKKNSPTLHGNSTAVDIVESYFPIMNNGQFAGAFEVYYDITKTLKSLKSIIIPATIIPTAGMFVFMGVIIFLLLKVSNSFTLLREAEDELVEYMVSLEDLVEGRTAELNDANKNITNSEHFLSNIFNSIQDPFCIFDKDLCVVRANKAYADLKGVPFDSLIGKCCKEMSAEQCANCIVNTTLESQDPCASERKVTLPDGQDAWVEVMTYPIFGSDDKVEFVVEYTRDVTSRVHAEEERKNLILELEKLSSTDALTGMLNRRAIANSLDAEIKRARRYQSSLSFIICDVDEFKEINDLYGHTSGDSALVQVASIINSMLRDTDIGGRFGGDEFVMILPQTDLEGASAIAERIRAKLEATTLDCIPENDSRKVTISLGVSSFHSDIEDSNELIVQADNALYASKVNGRNRVTTALS